jgi:nucleoside-diphosphate-sugar epimerase
MKESDQLMPTNPYAVSKAAAEMALTAQSLKGQTELIIVRPFTMYGDYMNIGKHALAIAKFIRAAERDEPLIIEGTGLQERDFVHADDAVRALELIIEKGRHKDIYNIGTGKYVSIKSIADAVSFKQVVAPERTGPVQRTWADVSKLRAMGFVPEVDLLDWLTVYLEINKIYKRIS